MKNHLTRRDVLKGAAALGLGSQAAAFTRFGKVAEDGPSNTRSLVLIYLRGGADFLNMVVPREDDSYGLSRPGIAIDKKSTLELNRDWGLHPALSDLKPIFDEKLFVPIMGVGSPHPTRSHFDAQDFMNYGAPGSRTLTSGWMNRYLTTTAAGEGAPRNDFRGIGMQRLLPTAIRGEFPVLAVPDGFNSRRASGVLKHFDRFYDADGKPAGDEGDGDPMDSRPEPDGGLDVLNSGKVTIESLRRFREIVSTKPPKKLGYPDTDLGKGMQRIAQVLLSGEGLEMAAIDYGGWDHHARQGGTRGAQANMLRNLGQSMGAFRKHMGQRMSETMVVVMTEFGRTVSENGSGGTDHGHGSGMFLMGGGLKAGKVHGKFAGLRTASLYQGRDLPVTTDFRDVIATVLREHLDFKLPKDFFPDYRAKKLKLFK